MAEEKTYLELSESSGSAHKFYEVIVDGVEVRIRFGRIGDQGQSQTAKYPTEEKAQAEANKKIKEKMKKGYAAAVMGERKKRTVTRRSAMFQESAASPRPAPSASQPAAKTAPVLWKFQTSVSALGIFIDDSLCWVGNEIGEIFALDHERNVRTQFKLPDGVKCIVADDDWLYAGCDDGNVYDLSSKVPRLAYEIAENVDIYWIDVKDGILAVSDALGNVTTINHEDESQWTKKSKGNKGWMVRCDEIGVFHGHGLGVTMYDWEDGREIWSRKTDGGVGFGWQEESMVYACTNRGKVHGFSKKGDSETVYHCDFYLCSCATAEDGKYVFAGDTFGDLYCFNEAGDRLWKLSSGCGASQSMQYLKERLYIVTNYGFLACVDVSEEAIKAAQQGSVPVALQTQAPKIEQPAAPTLETTSNRSEGVMVECFKEGDKLRIRVVSEGYKKDWNCQFPKDIREEGARYIVDEVREAPGGFYRAFGNIKKLTS